MRNDIVERLRHWRKELGMGMVPDVLADAADEIARLRVIADAAKAETEAEDADLKATCAWVGKRTGPRAVALSAAFNALLAARETRRRAVTGTVEAPQ